MFKLNPQQTFLLLFLFIASASVCAQEIFEVENAKFGYKNEMGQIVLAAQYDGVIKIETDWETFIFFAQKDPKNPPAADNPPFLDFTDREQLADIFQPGYLYGCFAENNPKKKTDCRYQKFEMYSAEGGGDVYYEILAAYDGKFYTFLLNTDLNKPLADTKFYADISPIFINVSYGKSYFLVNQQNQPSINVLEISLPNKKKSATAKNIFSTQYTNIIPRDINNENPFYIVQAGAKKGIADKSGKIKIPTIYDFIELIDSNSYLTRFVCSGEIQGKKQGYIIDIYRPERKFPVPYMESFSNTTFEERNALIYQVGDKQGLLVYVDEDADLKSFIPAQYDAIHKNPELDYFEAVNDKGLDIYTNEGKKYSISGVNSSNPNFFGDDSDLLLVSKNINQLSKNSVNTADVQCVWDKKTGKMLIEEVNYLTISADKKILTYKVGGKEGKMGIFFVESKMIAFEPLYEQINMQFIPNSDGNGGSYLAIVSQNGKKGVIAAGSKQPLIPIQYQNISFEPGQQPFFIVYQPNDKNKADTEPKCGAINLRGEQLLAIEYDYLQYPINERYLWAHNYQTKTIKAYDVRKRQFVPQLENCQILGLADSAHWNIRQGDKLGKIHVNSLTLSFEPSITDFYKLKWKKEIGLSSFRSNIFIHNGLIVVGSNGRNRDKVENAIDDLDGLYLLNPKNGATVQQIRSQTGDDDINGAAAVGNNLYVGGDAKILFAYEWVKTAQNPLKERWSLDVGGEIEGSPALSDLNGDGFMDVVVATESPAKIFAVNGKNGVKIWEYTASERGYFMATPALADLNGDKIPEVLIGLGGGNHFLAIDGKNGQELWKYKTLSNAGFVDGSAIHSSATVLIDKKGEPTIIVSECYGIIHFLDKKGKLQKYISTNIGLFSSPVFSPNMTMVSGSSWWGSGQDGVNICLAGKNDSWAKDEKTGWDYIANEKYYIDWLSYRTSASAFVADILSQKTSQQIGIADEAGVFILIDENTGAILQRFALPTGIEASIFVADVDLDGKLELLIAGLDGFLYCYATNAPASNKIYWGQFRANNQNTGILYSK